jgi:hypothetical protein
MAAAGQGAVGEEAILQISLGLSVEAMPLMSLPQKKVALIYYILFGDISDQEIDWMVSVVAAPA